MSNKTSSHVNKRASTIIILCGILVESAVLGALISFSGITSKTYDKEIKGGISEAEASTNSSSAAATRKEYTLIAEDAELEIAPGEIVKTWTFNGTMPGPTLRFTEGDNVTIKFINKTPIPHTIHFHGNHDDVNDGVYPQIMPNQTYLYNITAAPAGALMYHCHAHPTTLHIRMGMYGALIVDPKDKPLPPAKEFVMVMGEFDDDNIMNFETKYYPINGYVDQYVRNPIVLNYGELLRLYVINLGTTIPNQFHLHSTTFKAYPSGLLSNEPIDAQTISVGPGDATIIEARWEYPGTYLFHSHGIQEERGNMGQIVVAENPNEKSNDNNNNNNQQGSGNENRSTSMFEWQYQLQKTLQHPRIINYSDAQISGIQRDNKSNSDMVAHGNTTTIRQPTANASGADIPEHQLQHDTNSRSGSVIANNIEISIVEGASSPSNEFFYYPSPAAVKRGNSVIWTNNDSIPHTATSGNAENGEAQTETLFDTGILGPGNSSEAIRINAADAGMYNYYCTLHPFMKGQLTIED